MGYGMQSTAGLRITANEAARESADFGIAYSTFNPDSRRNAPIRIYTMGRFSVAFDGRPVGSGGKGKQRPLSLLKALIALGGRDVAINLLCECLWPDSDGDLGGRNLTITVHRLRRMLQAHATVLQHDGKLTLNEQVCWVDAWNFERLVNDGLRRIDESVTGDAPEIHLRAALSLYAGDFLARESEESWMLAPRLRLKTKFERLVSALSMHLERQGRFADAIDVCLQAIEREPLNEVLYRRLMSCYLMRGEIAAVVRTYTRCREALAKGLAMRPSVETNRVYLQGVDAAAAHGAPQ